MEKRDAARMMYMGGAKQADIARVLGLAPRTVSAWQTRGGWKTKRVNAQLLKMKSQEALLEMIEYQTNALKRRKDMWLKEDPESTMLFSGGDLDGLYKLFNTLAKDDRAFKHYLAVMKEFMKYAEKEDYKMAKELTDLAESFIQYQSERV